MTYKPRFQASRRSVLKGTGAAFIGLTMMPYKSMAQEEKKLNFYNWDTYIGENTLDEFNKASGIEVNTTEKRAALHMACRSFGEERLLVSGNDVMPSIRRVRDEIRQFSSAVRAAEITGSTGKKWKRRAVKSNSFSG